MLNDLHALDVDTLHWTKQSAARYAAAAPREPLLGRHRAAPLRLWRLGWRKAPE